MAVDFCDYFWGEKHEGFSVLYQNMKCGLTATKDLSEVVKETALLQENNAKVFAKISKQLGASVQIGSFSPILVALKTATEKFSNAHSSSLTKITDLLKELNKYSEELSKKHKQIKDEEAPTSDIVKAFQETSLLLQKSKDFYKAKSVELEKLKGESPTPKELEKSEAKFRKAQDEYKGLCEKFSSQREDFEKKMLSSCKHFQQAETLYLTQMVDFIHSFHDLLDGHHNSVGKISLELEEQLVGNTVEKLLEQFVLAKHTGLIRPASQEFEPENVSLSSLNTGAGNSGGPPSDISDRSGNSDKASIEKGPIGGSGLMAKKDSTGFLKNRRKKERKRSSKAKDEFQDGDAGKDMGSDGEERAPSDTPTPEQGPGAGLRLPPPPPKVSDPWADFNRDKKSFYSSSDSDSDDQEVKKIKINIRPAIVDSNARSATSASVDELQRAVGGIDINAATLPNKRTTPSAEMEVGGALRKGKSSHSHSHDLLGLFPPELSVSGVSSEQGDTQGVWSGDTSEVLAPVPSDQLSVSATNTSTGPPSLGLDPLSVSQASGDAVSVPGAESTRLDTSQDVGPANTSKEVSDLFNDIHELTKSPSGDSDTDTAPPLPTTSAPPLPPPSTGETPWPEDPPQNASTTEEGDFGDSQGFDMFSEPVQPALPPKMRQSAASSAREKVASSLIPLPRPPSRHSGRVRSTPSPTPTSVLPTTALSLPRSESRESPGVPRVNQNRESPGLSRVAPNPVNPIRALPRSDSIGSESARKGPLLPTPPRTESPVPGTTRASVSSRGPSPLTLTGADTVPLAVAFQEVVHAAFRGSDESMCLVRMLGDMMLSFPAGIVGVLATNPYPAPLQFRIRNAGRLESVLPNKQLVTPLPPGSPPEPDSDTLAFEFNMASLQQLLARQAQLNPNASYFNIDILKYQISSLPGTDSCPFHIMSYWRCEEGHTDLRIDYKYNQYAMSRPSSLLNLSLAVPLDGGVQSMMSEPKGTWVQETARAVWKIPEVSVQSPGQGVGSIRARFQLNSGPGSQSAVAAQFNCEGTTLSGVEFELQGQGYRVSLVKRRFVSGKYVSEADPSNDKYRYAAPPPLSSSDC